MLYHYHIVFRGQILQATWWRIQKYDWEVERNNLSVLKERREGWRDVSVVKDWAHNPQTKENGKLSKCTSYTHMKPIIINNSFQPQDLSCSLLQISLKTFCFQCRKLSAAQCLLKTSPPSPKAKQSIRLSPVQFPQNISSFAPYIHLLPLLEYKNGPTSWRRQSLRLQIINHLGNLILSTAIFLVTTMSAFK